MCAKDWFYDTIYREEIVPATTTDVSSTTGECHFQQLNNLEQLPSWEFFLFPVHCVSEDFLINVNSLWIRHQTAP